MFGVIFYLRGLSIFMRSVILFLRPFNSNLVIAYLSLDNFMRNFDFNLVNLIIALFHNVVFLVNNGIFLIHMTVLLLTFYSLGLFARYAIFIFVCSLRNLTRRQCVIFFLCFEGLKIGHMVFLVRSWALHVLLLIRLK